MVGVAFMRPTKTIGFDKSNPYKLFFKEDKNGL